MRCPTCRGAELERRIIRETILGADLGEVPADVCPACGESLLDEAAMDTIEQRAKAAGVWGLARNLRVERAGEDLILRIPRELAQRLALHEGRRLSVHVEGDDRIVVDLEG